MTYLNNDKTVIIIDQHFISPNDDNGNNTSAYESSMRYATATDTNPLFVKKSRKERALLRRGAFHWLPFYCSNDLKHGSWWFLWASLLATFIPVIPLINLFVPFWATTITTSTPGTLPLLQNVETYSLLICSGILCTLGSMVFVRAAEEPPLRPLLSSLTSHFATDELLAAWLFFLSSIPLVPFMAVYVYYNHKVLVYWGLMITSIVFSLATYLFVLSCYPSDYNNPSSSLSHSASHTHSHSLSHQSHLYSKIKSIAIGSSDTNNTYPISNSLNPKYGSTSTMMSLCSDDNDDDDDDDEHHLNNFKTFYTTINNHNNDYDYENDDYSGNSINEHELEKRQHQDYQQQRQIIPKLLISILGEYEWITIHCCNDWLAAMWIFLYVTLLMMIGSLLMAVISLHTVDKNQLEVYDWWTSTIDCFMFLIGSAYMCAGSYPQQHHHHHHHHKRSKHDNMVRNSSPIDINTIHSSIHTKHEYTHNYSHCNNSNNCNNHDDHDDDDDEEDIAVVAGSVSENANSSSQLLSSSPSSCCIYNTTATVIIPPKATTTAAVMRPCQSSSLSSSPYMLHSKNNNNNNNNNRNNRSHSNSNNNKSDKRNNRFNVNKKRYIFTQKSSSSSSSSFSQGGGGGMSGMSETAPLLG